MKHQPLTRKVRVVCEDCDGECDVDWIDLDKFVPKEDDDA